MRLTGKISLGCPGPRNGIPLEELCEVQDLVLLECGEAFIDSLWTFHTSNDGPFRLLFPPHARRDNLLLHRCLVLFLLLLLQLTVDFILIVFALSWSDGFIVVPFLAVDLVLGERGYSCDTELVRKGGASGKVEAGENTV